MVLGANLGKLGFFKPKLGASRWLFFRVRVYNQSRKSVDNFSWNSQRVTREKRCSNVTLKIPHALFFVSKSLGKKDDYCSTITDYLQHVNLCTQIQMHININIANRD